ncbi:hypothetical protein CRG98_037047 [Punica granatum]|uniref:Integrase catalytic domain-containing protein n=1 Tax=Punica granatum TaxID=22663 RepID=A0A2I0IF16_PUNGR|nr:hypothetical protein CRG98_037047 [Punica granatum]
MNGAMEAANKNVKRIIEKMTVNYKDWHDMLPYKLLAYRTSICTSTGATPYSLVYGTEAVLPIECYQQRMARAFNTRVRHCEFKPGDLVLRKVLHITFSGGAIILSDMDGTENALPVNANTIKKYYP